MGGSGTQLGGELGSKGVNGTCETTGTWEGRLRAVSVTPVPPLKFSRKKKTVKCKFSSYVDTELKYIMLYFQTGRKYLGKEML